VRGDGGEEKGWCCEQILISISAAPPAAEPGGPAGGVCVVFGGEEAGCGRARGGDGGGLRANLGTWHSNPPAAEPGGSVGGMRWVGGRAKARQHARPFCLLPRAAAPLAAGRRGSAGASSWESYSER